MSSSDWNLLGKSPFRGGVSARSFRASRAGFCAAICLRPARNTRLRHLATFVASVVLLPGIAASQSFRTAVECDQVLKNIESQASHWDSAFMDCAAGAADYRVHDCRGMDTQSRIAAFKADAAKRDALTAQAKSIRPMCEQLHAAERQRERQDAIDRSRQQQAQEQERKRTQLSIEQYNNARIAEARNLADNNHRYEELKRQQLSQQQAAAKAEADRQAAMKAQERAAAKSAIVDQSMSALRSLAGLPDPPSSPTIDTYTNIQRGVQKLHEGIQKNQPDVVNEIQNHAWSAIEERNTETLNQVQELKRSIDSFSTEMKASPSPSPAPTTSRSSTLPAASSRGVDADLEQIAAGAYGTRAPPTDSQTHVIAMAASTGTRLQQKAEDGGCDAYQPPTMAQPSNTGATVTASQRCAAARTELAERKRALAQASRCGQSTDIAEIQRQIKGMDDRVKRDCR